MRTAWPATRTALSRVEFLNRPLDSPAARGSLFCRGNPTNPLIACQRRQIPPRRLRCSIRTEGLAEVRRSLMQWTGLAFVIHDHARCRLNAKAAGYDEGQYTALGVLGQCQGETVVQIQAAVFVIPAHRFGRHTRASIRAIPQGCFMRGAVSNSPLASILCSARKNCHPSIELTASLPNSAIM